MKILFNIPHFLTDTTNRLGVLLTLMFFAVFPIHAFSAGSLTTTYPVYQTSDSNVSEDTAEHGQRVQSMVQYARQQVPNLLPGLPDELRSTMHWVMGGFHNNTTFVSVGVIGDYADSSIVSGLRPDDNLSSPTASDAESTWLSSAYHHRNGFLPTHDAMMAGTHSQQNLFDHYMSLDMHPYVAQNYFSAKHFYGTELSLDLATPSETSDVTRPWGKMVVGYTNGDSGMTDHGRGIDLHGELRFSDNLTLNSGLRQSDSSGGGNYVMLQWKLATE